MTEQTIESILKKHNKAIIFNSIAIALLEVAIVLILIIKL